jgi:hypothetical protein
VEVGKNTFREGADKVCLAIDLALENLAALKVRVEKAIRKAIRDAMIQIEGFAKDMRSRLE